MDHLPASYVMRVPSGMPVLLTKNQQDQFTLQAM